MASPLVYIGAAAGSDDTQIAFDQARHKPPLAVPEIILAIALEDFGRRKPRRIFDLGIAVDERQAEAPRKAPAYGRLSYPHQPDQHYRPVEPVRQFIHRKGYTAAPPLGKSARMSRLVVLIIVLVVIIGGLIFLSTVPKQQPTHTIEVAVPQAGGNAH